MSTFYFSLWGEICKVDSLCVQVLRVEVPLREPEPYKEIPVDRVNVPKTEDIKSEPETPKDIPIDRVDVLKSEYLKWNGK